VEFGHNLLTGYVQTLVLRFLWIVVKHVVGLVCCGLVDLLWIHADLFTTSRNPNSVPSTYCGLVIDPATNPHFDTLECYGFVLHVVGL